MTGSSAVVVVVASVIAVVGAVVVSVNPTSVEAVVWVIIVDSVVEVISVEADMTVVVDSADASVVVVSTSVATTETAIELTVEDSEGKSEPVVSETTKVVDLILEISDAEYNLVNFDL